MKQMEWNLPLCLKILIFYVGIPTHRYLRGAHSSTQPQTFLPAHMRNGFVLIDLIWNLNESCKIPHLCCSTREVTKAYEIKPSYSRKNIPYNFNNNRQYPFWKHFAQYVSSVIISSLCHSNKSLCRLPILRIRYEQRRHRASHQEARLLQHLPMDFPHSR